MKINNKIKETEIERQRLEDSLTSLGLIRGLFNCFYILIFIFVGVTIVVYGINRQLKINQDTIKLEQKLNKQQATVLVR